MVSEFEHVEVSKGILNTGGESGPTWDLGFLGILSYLVMEYTRLPAMFPFLIPFQLGKLAIGLSLIGFLMSTAEGESIQKPVGLYIATGAFLFTTTLSCVFAIFPDVAWAYMPDVIQWGTILFLISRIVCTRQRLRIFMVVLIVLNMKLGQHAIRNYASMRELGESTEILSSRGVGAGSTGFFGNPGDFGVAMSVIWPLTGALAFGERKKYTRWTLLFCWLIFLGAVILCGSRGALLAAGMAAMISLIRNPSRKGGLIIAFMFAAGLFFVLPQANINRFKSGMTPEHDETAQIRLRLWRAGRTMFKEHLMFGVGLMNFRPVYHTQFAEGRAGYAWAPHSIYVEALSELGAGGSVPLIALWILCFRLNSATRKRVSAFGGTRSDFEYRLSTGLDLALVSYLVSGAFLTVLYYPHQWIILGLSSGTFIAAQKTFPKIRQEAITECLPSVAAAHSR